MLVIIKFITYSATQIHYCLIFSPIIYSSIIKQNTMKFAFTQAEVWY